MCENHVFPCVGSEHDPSLPTALLTGFSRMKGNPVLFFVFNFWNDNRKEGPLFLPDGITVHKMSILFRYNTYENINS